MPFPLAPHHVQLINACYPPSSTLLSAGPDYKPNSQELSRLAYYASNRPGKIAKLAVDLEKRALGDARKAAAGNARSRAQLLITLNIFKTLIEECRQDISLLSPALMSVLDAGLAALSSDLEVVAKFASVLSAWATFTNGSLLGVDQVLTRCYLSCLRRFSSFGTFEEHDADTEMRNRKRIIGLSTLSAAVTSEALYNSSSQFKPQVLIIVPPLIFNILTLEGAVLDKESENNKRDNVASLDLDIRSRPLLERRAASIHVHIDGEEGPTDGDVANVALKALKCLLSQSGGSQVSLAVQTMLDSIGMYDGWGDRERCCWICWRTIEWIQYQYRFVVPMRLVDKLLEAQGDATPSDLHRTLAAMLKAAFKAPVPLVNLSTSEICGRLTNMMLRRVDVNPEDEFLAELIECVGCLGSHIYYADQIHDLACEIITGLSNIENNGLGPEGRVYGTQDRKREIALRCLIACLGQLIEQSSRSLQSATIVNGHHPTDSLTSTFTATGINEAVTSTSVATETASAKAAKIQRSRISPEVWQETLSLLCDENFSVRSEYVRVLVLFIETELEHEPASQEEPESHETIKSSASPNNRPRNIQSFTERVTDRFLQALNASLYILATSPRLGLPPSSSPPTPSHSDDNEKEEDLDPDVGQILVNITPSTPQPGQSFTSVNETQAAEASISYPRRKSFATSVSPRKVCRIRRILEWPHAGQDSDQSMDSSACLSDYSLVLRVLEVAHEQTAPRSLLIGVPMLLALQMWCETDNSEAHKRAAVQEVVFRQWKIMAKIWGLSTLQEIVIKSELESSFPYPPPDTQFPCIYEARSLKDFRATKRHFGDLASVPNIFAEDTRVQRLTNLDEFGVKEQLSSSWTPESALEASIENNDYANLPRSGHVSPRLKLSPALMHISNLSLQSLNRTRGGIGVSDLRDALEGRLNLSNLALTKETAPSVASLGFSASGASAESAFSPSAYSMTRSKSPAFSGDGPKDVKTVLDKLGIGSPTSPSKSPLSLPPTSPRSTYLVPPYKV